MKTIYCLIILLCSCPYLVGQNSFQTGFLPNVNVIRKFSNDWKINFRTESRQRFSSGIFGEASNTKYEYLLTDFSATVSKKTGINNSLAAGYLTRFRDSNMIHRLTQQLTITGKFTGFRLSHRIRTDQTFEQNDAPEFRFRYRITPEIPLNGLSIDPREFYLKINNEYLNSFQSDAYDLEIRLVPLLGYEFSDKNKVESGLDYRIASFINQGSRNSFWFTINWYITI